MKYISIFVIMLIPGKLLAQDDHSYRSTFFSASYIQVKEEANYGLVFRGPALDFGMRWEIPFQNQKLEYEYHFGVGFPLAKEIIGLNISFKPVDVSYLWDLPVGGINLKAGPAVKMQYDLQIYPDLQSGYDFWLTSYCAGIKLEAILPTSSGTLRMNLYNSLLGLTSRTEPYPNPYFFELGFGEVMKDVHSNFKFSSLNRFINTTFAINYQFRKHDRLSVSYLLDYSNYSEVYNLKLLNQTLRFIINAKK